MNILDNIAKTSRKFFKQARGEAFCGGCGGSNVCSCAGGARRNCPCGCLRACPCVKPRYCPFRRCNYCPRNCRMKCMRCLACNAGMSGNPGMAAESFTAITNYPSYDQCLAGTPYGQLYNGNIHQQINAGSGQNITSLIQTCSGNPLASGSCGGPAKIADDCGCTKKIAADSYMIFSDAGKYFVGPIGVAAKKDGNSFYYSPYRGCR